MLGHKIALASIHVNSATKMVVPRSADPAENFTLPKHKHMPSCYYSVCVLSRIYFCRSHCRRNYLNVMDIFLLTSGFPLNSLFDGKFETIDTSENVFWCINKLISIWKHARCNTSVVSPHNVFSVYLHVEQKKKDRYFIWPTADDGAVKAETFVTWCIKAKNTMVQVASMMTRAHKNGRLE